MAIYPLITLSCEELAGFADGAPKYDVVPLLFASNIYEMIIIRM